jgi:glycosyltransferase involved in cell wall biosynthesis
MHVLAPRRTVKKAERPITSEELPGNVVVHNAGHARDEYFHNFSFQLQCRGKIESLIRELKIDIVHSHSSMPDFLVPPSKLNVPIVTTIHTTIQGHATSLMQLGVGLSDMKKSEVFTLAAAPFLRYLEDLYYRSNRYFLTVSEWGRREISREKDIDNSRIRAIHIGVDTSLFTPTLRQKANTMLPVLAGISKPIVLYLSRFAARKGIHDLLKAIPIALGETDVHFVFAGSNKPETLKLPERNCTFLGYVPRGVPPYLYAVSDIYVLPSLYENFPASVLEAMASSCAVVATNICGIPEMIENRRNGLLIEPRSPNSIARAIIELAENPDLRATLGQEARKDAVAGFSWEKTVKETIEYYHHVMSDFETRKSCPTAIGTAA